MSKPFFERLRRYYLDVAAVLRGEANIGSVFPNTTDNGMSRELIYAEFLRQHAPSKCNVFLGGFIFGEDGDESGQLDVLITTDTTPQYNLLSKSGQGKSFLPVEGTLGVVSIKSTLNKFELGDCLRGMARIPATSPLKDRVTFGLTIKDYDDWPCKVIYASDGITGAILMAHLLDFYESNRGIPFNRRPNIIHVAGKYIITRATHGHSVWNNETGLGRALIEGDFNLFETDSDLQGITWVLDDLQLKAALSSHIMFSYSEIMNRVKGIPKDKSTRN